MNAAVQPAKEETLGVQRSAYDPNNLQPLDADARKFDDTSEGIDWDEIIATTQDDYLAGRFAFNSAGYPTHEAAMAAMKQHLDKILEKVLREKSATPSLD